MKTGGMESGSFFQRPGLLYGSMTLHLEMVQEAECLHLNNFTTKGRASKESERPGFKSQHPHLSIGCPLKVT